MFVFMAWIGLSGSIGGQESAGKASGIHQEAVRLFRSGKNLEAGKLWEGLLTDGDNGLSLANRLEMGRRAAIAYTKGERRDRALKIAQWCRKKAPDDPAFAKLEKAIAKGGGEAGGGAGGGASESDLKQLFNKGKSAYERAEIEKMQGSALAAEAWTEAIEIFEKLVPGKLRPSDVRFFLGSAYFNRGKEGDSAKAVAHLEESIKLDEQDPRAYLDLGEIFGLKGDKQKEQALYEKALASNPSCEECHYRVALIYDKTGDAAMADKIFAHAKEAIDINPEYKPPLVVMIENKEASEKIIAIPTPTPEPTPVPTPEPTPQPGQPEPVKVEKKESENERLQRVAAEAIAAKRGMTVEQVKADPRFQMYKDNPAALEMLKRMLGS